MKKEFTEINGFSNYEVSAEGKVRSIATKKYKRLCKDSKGRAIVVLTDDDKGYASALYIQDLIHDHFGNDAASAYVTESGEDALSNYESLLKKYQELSSKYDTVIASSDDTVAAPAKKGRRCKKIRCNETGEVFKSFAEAAKHYETTYDKFYDAIYNRGNFKGMTFERLES